MTGILTLLSPPAAQVTSDLRSGMPEECVVALEAARQEVAIEVKSMEEARHREASAHAERLAAEGSRATAQRHAAKQRAVAASQRRREDVEAARTAEARAAGWALGGRAGTLDADATRLTAALVEQALVRALEHAEASSLEALRTAKREANEASETARLSAAAARERIEEAQRARDAEVAAT